jgi:hypothetical protein
MREITDLFRFTNAIWIPSAVMVKSGVPGTASRLPRGSSKYRGFNSYDDPNSLALSRLFKPKRNQGIPLPFQHPCEVGGHHTEPRGGQLLFGDLQIMQ